MGFTNDGSRRLEETVLMRVDGGGSTYGSSGADEGFTGMDGRCGEGEEDRRDGVPSPEVVLDGIDGEGVDFHPWFLKEKANRACGFSELEEKVFH
ncbi:hypothetical protein U1Q18_012395 [Sarracenia purpurea var. burkii]